MTTTIGERISHIRGSRTQAAFAKVLGIHKNSLGNYERGDRTPDADCLKALALQGVSVHWILTGHGPKYMAPQQSRAQHYLMEEAAAQDPDRVGEAGSRPYRSQLADFDQVPLYDIRAAAGGGAIVQEEEPVSMLAFRRDWLRRELGAASQDLAALEAEGESMVPTITPGDVLLVDLRDTGPSRDGIYVLRLDDALVVKRVQRLPGKRLILKSEHPAYEPFELDQADMENNGAAVVGRVVWAGRRM